MLYVRLDAKMAGQAEVLRALYGLSGKQLITATVKAINDTAYEARRAMQEEMRAVFDRPTNYILKSPRVKQARSDRLFAVIEPAYMGGKGVDPQKILNAQSSGQEKRGGIAPCRHLAQWLPDGHSRSTFPWQ